MFTNPERTVINHSNSSVSLKHFKSPNQYQFVIFFDAIVLSDLKQIIYRGPRGTALTSRPEYLSSSFLFYTKGEKQKCISEDLYLQV